MARKSTGTVIETELGDGTRSFAIRFRANGRRIYRTLGYTSEGWTRKRAEEELANVMADVRRGLWREPEPEPEPAPRFYDWAEQWFEGRRLEGGARGMGLTPAGEADLRWRLAHLLEFFVTKLRDPRLDEITVEHVDAYRREKVREGSLGATSINKTLATLSAMFEDAVEYEHIQRNPAKGRRRRLKQVKPRRTFLDRADHIAALLDAAGGLDRAARAGRRHVHRRHLLATLVFAGLRIGEALALQWRDVDLARGVIRVRASKTEAGIRTVNIVPVLRDELLALRAQVRDAQPKDLVFPTSTGKQLSETNVRRRILAPARDLANTVLEQAEEEALPSLTPHSLRRTFASLLFAIGEDAPYVMAQLGHTTPELTLEVYARAMHRRDGEKARLRALVEGEEWSGTGQSGARTSAGEGQAAAGLEAESPA